jgi:hypothetical protein
LLGTGRRTKLWPNDSKVLGYSFSLLQPVAKIVS